MKMRTEGDGIESRLPFKIFSTLPRYALITGAYLCSDLNICKILLPNLIPRQGHRNVKGHENLSPPYCGILCNPISIKGADYAHHISPFSPQFF